MVYGYSKVKEGDVLWGCAYSIDSTKERMRLKCEPELGIIKKIGYRMQFVKLKKNGEPSAKAVCFSARHYADTKEECIMLYNNLIAGQVTFLERIIDEMNLDKLEVR